MVEKQILKLHFSCSRVTMSADDNLALILWNCVKDSYGGRPIPEEELKQQSELILLHCVEKDDVPYDRVPNKMQAQELKVDGFLRKALGDFFFCLCAESTKRKFEDNQRLKKAIDQLIAFRKNKKTKDSQTAAQEHQNSNLVVGGQGSTICQNCINTGGAAFMAVASQVTIK